MAPSCVVIRRRVWGEEVSLGSANGVVYRLNHQDSRTAIPHVAGLENHVPRQLTLDAHVIHLGKVGLGIRIAGGYYGGNGRGFQRTVRYKRCGNEQGRIDVVS